MRLPGRVVSDRRNASTLGPNRFVFSTLVALAIVVLGAIALGWVPIGGRGSAGTISTCTPCFRQEPIVDILSPALGNSTSGSNVNRTIDMRAGSSRTFEVDIYPTLGINVTMGFAAILVYPSSGATAGQIPSATFDPAGLGIASNAKGVTLMTLYVPQASPKGTYDSVVTAMDDANGSYVWGLYFQLVVG